MKPINIKVQMSFGSFIVVGVDSSTTVGETFDKVTKKAQLIDPANYYLYFCINTYLVVLLYIISLFFWINEVLGNGERCLTNDNEKICDLITKAEHINFDSIVSCMLKKWYKLEPTESKANDLTTKGKPVLQSVRIKPCFWRPLARAPSSPSHPTQRYLL